MTPPLKIDDRTDQLAATRRTSSASRRSSTLRPSPITPAHHRADIEEAVKAGGSRRYDGTTESRVGLLSGLGAGSRRSAASVDRAAGPGSSDHQVPWGNGASERAGDGNRTRMTSLEGWNANVINRVKVARQAPEIRPTRERRATPVPHGIANSSRCSAGQPRLVSHPVVCLEPSRFSAAESVLRSG